MMAGLLTTLPARGWAAEFGFRDLNIPGATGVSIAGINDFGVATGTYFGPSVSKAPFVGSLNAVKRLPYIGNSPDAVVAFPSGIANSRFVIGTYKGAYLDGESRRHGFYYSHGSVSPLGDFRSGDTVQVSVSHFGRAVEMSVTAAYGAARPYLVRCEAGEGAC